MRQASPGAHESFREAPVPNIHALPRPARELLPNQHYRYLFSTRRGFGTMITSRGCPFRCSFCDKSVSGSRWRARKAADIVDEMAFMRQQHNIRFINFYDDNFLLHRQRVMDICHELIRRKVDVEWKCEGRVDAVDRELLTLMRKAGCRVVAYGVESGNAESLELLRKDISVEQSVQAFALTKEAGLRSLAYMILGVPGEDRQTVQKSIDFTHQIGADYVQFSSLTIMPGTPLYAMGHASSASIKNPLDGDLNRKTLSDLPPEELQRLLRQAWTGFYLRPTALRRLSVDAFRSGSLTEMLRMGVALGRWSLSPS